MEFCPKCGAIIIQKRTKFGCPQCNYISKGKVKVAVKEKVNAKEVVAVVKEGTGNIAPVIEWICPKCKNNKAYFWTRQMRSSDEAESKFFECTKCKNCVREDR